MSASFLYELYVTTTGLWDYRAMGLVDDYRASLGPLGDHCGTIMGVWDYGTTMGPLC